MSDSVLLVRADATGGILRHVQALDIELQNTKWQTHELVLTIKAAAIVDQLRALRKQSGQVEVVHAHGLKAGLACVLLSKAPVVLTVHNVSFDGQSTSRRIATKAMELFLGRKSEAIISTSVGIQSELASLGVPIKRITVIRPFGLDPVPQHSSSEVREALSLPSDRPLVVTVARLHEQKDLPTLFRAIKQSLVTQEFQLVVVGSGPDKEELRALANELQVAANITFVDSYSDVPALLEAACVVVCSSVWESGPLAILEAALLGCAIVSTPVGFVPELCIDGENARLVQVGSADHLGQAISELLRNPVEAKRLGAAARTSAEAWFRKDELVDHIVSVYKSVLTAQS